MRDHLYTLLEDASLTTIILLIYQYGVCPAHFRLSVRQSIDEEYPFRRIGVPPYSLASNKPRSETLRLLSSRYIKELVRLRAEMGRDI